MTVFRALGLSAAVLTFSLASCAAPQGDTPAAPGRPSRVIVLIGDGVGTAYWTAARFTSQPLAVERFTTMGLADTRSTSSWITDSAAGATAYSTGVRTYNGAIGVGPDSLPVPTVLEVARDQGWGTGIVSTSSVTHATPASFVAHAASRSQEYDIAKDIVASRVDVFLGGGLRRFAGATRPDSTDLVGTVRSTHTLVTSAAELAAVDTASTTRLAGLFADVHMPAAAERTPTLPDMTRAALSVLANDPDGFFLMVEGSQPDWIGHDNAPIEDLAREVLDFDAAIAAVLDFADANPGTLVLVLADHETGGLAIELTPDSLRSEGTPPSPFADYATTGHTGQMTPMFAAGPGAERFGGIKDNFRVGQILMELVKR
ncbi:MAG: alkaline phosphatase [Gemmatimonadetes bacterium]|nr:alkaline phosphatase [Gemmatimonadota bacterium]